jgi:hypothetical protein
VGSTQAEKAVLNLNKYAVMIFSNMFKTVHALCKKGRPFTDFTWQCQLDLNKGIPIGSAYQSDKQAKYFSNFFAKAQRLKQERQLKKAPFLTIITDGSTDSAIIEEEIHYCRFCVNGDINVLCLGIESVERADSQHLTEAIGKALANKVNMTFRK